MEPATFFKWTAGVIGTIVLLLLLKNWGLLGKTSEEKSVEDLYNNPAMTGDTNAASKFRDAIAKKLGKKSVTATDVKAYSPTGTTLQQWDTQLKKARGTFNDDETAVFTVFRQMKSQLAMYTFSQYFVATNKKSVIDYLNEFLDYEELARINEIVEKKPVI